MLLDRTREGQKKRGRGSARSWRGVVWHKQTREKVIKGLIVRIGSLNSIQLKDPFKLRELRVPLNAMG